MILEEKEVISCGSMSLASESTAHQEQEEECSRLAPRHGAVGQAEGARARGAGRGGGNRGLGRDGRPPSPVAPACGQWLCL